MSTLNNTTPKPTQIGMPLRTRHPREQKQTHKNSESLALVCWRHTHPSSRPLVGDTPTRARGCKLGWVWSLLIDPPPTLLLHDIAYSTTCVLQVLHPYRTGPADKAGSPFSPCQVGGGGGCSYSRHNRSSMRPTLLVVYAHSAMNLISW